MKKTQPSFRQRTVSLIQGRATPGAVEFLRKRKLKTVVLLEGRPDLDAASLTGRQLLKAGMKPILITDNMAGFLFYKEWIKEIWLASHIFDAKGALCDIGAMVLGVLAKHHGVPVKLVPGRFDGRLLADPKDLFYFKGKKVAPADVEGYVPLVEWLPRKYITEIWA